VNVRSEFARRAYERHRANMDVRVRESRRGAAYQRHASCMEGGSAASGLFT
jgi:hypothetical protein